MKQQSFRPKKRSMLRIWCGKRYYCARRYLQWYFSSLHFAKEQSKNKLASVVFQHQTPLRRKLKDVDMWLQENKVQNLAIAVQKLNNMLVKPGETFSYWKLIGRPTRQKGYVDGLVLFYGRCETGIGGGLCQLSNLIYWLTLHTPLTVVERYRHSYDVFPDSNRTQPFGSGATCVYNYRDLQVYNGTDTTFQLSIRLSDHALIGEWRSSDPQYYHYQVYEKEHSITHELWGGYVRHNLLYRKVYDMHEHLIDDHYLTENHALMMYEPYLEAPMNSKS